MVLVAAAGLYRLAQSAAAREHVAMLRDSVQMLRTASDTCNAELRGSQDDLLQYRERLDSLHDAVRAFEEVELGGVPQEQYVEYMTRFAQYRDSAAAWDDRVDSVRTRLDTCRVLARQHNEVMDSLRAVLQ